MAAHTWPGTLPVTFAPDGFEETIINPAVRSEVDVGPPQTRRRYTAPVRMWRGTMELDATQRQTLEDFYLNTVNVVEAFNLKKPYDHASEVDARFVNPPTFRADGPLGWIAQVEVEVLP